MEPHELSLKFKALGDPTRLRIYEFLRSREHPVAVDDEGGIHPIRGVTVGEVCCHLTGNEKCTSTISFHLKELKIAGLIEAERSGRFLICRTIPSAWDELSTYFTSPPSATHCEPPVIAPAQLLQGVPR